MAYPYSSASRTRNQNAIDYTVKGGVETSPTSANTKVTSRGTNVPLWKIDMGKQAHFTIHIQGMDRPNMKHSKYGAFLPVKSLNYTPVSLDSLRITVGLFGDILIPQHRKMGRIELEINDTSDHFYENMFYTWYAKTVPDNSGYIGYFKDFVKQLEYREFDHEGKPRRTYYMEVIPDGDIRVSRSYEANEIKVFSVTLVIVGIITYTDAVNKEPRVEKSISGGIIREG